MGWTGFNFSRRASKHRPSLVGLRYSLLPHVSKRDTLHRLAEHAWRIRREWDVLAGAPGLPRHVPSHPLVITGRANEAHTGWLDYLTVAIRSRVLYCALREEAAALTLLAWMDEAANTGNGLVLGVLDREDATRTVNTRLRGTERGRIKGAVFVPLDGDRCHVSRRWDEK